MENLFLTLLVLTSTLCASVSPYNIPAIFSFGDSIFDAGNNHFIKNCTAQADFPPYSSSFFHHPTGRFTNGRTVVDFISQFIGIDFQIPNLEAKIAVMKGSRKSYPHNGINFASAGSGVLRGTNKEERVIPMQDQLQQFRTLVEQKLIDKSLVQKSFFFFEAGSNDIFNYFVPSNPPKPDPHAYVQAMLVEVETFVVQIYKLGGRKIALFSLGPVGCVPARALLPGAPNNRCYGKINVMVKEYNRGLESLVEHMHIKYPHAIGVYGAIYNIVQKFRANPTHYRFSDVGNACCGDGTLGGMLQCGKKGYKICSNPNSFLFWDFFHPSEHAYKLVSKALWGGRKSRIRPFNLKTLANITLQSDLD